MAVGLEAVGSVPTNKYAEGYPGKRYYGGCEVVDEIETIAIDRAKSLFGAEHANVQPHAGAQANMAVYHGLPRARGHGARVAARPRRAPHPRAQGQLLGSALQRRALRRLAGDEPRRGGRGPRARPRAPAQADPLRRLGVLPGRSTPRMFRAVADEVGALLWCDMAHFAGLVAAGLHPNPVEDCDVVTSTTHKTLAGPRVGLHPLSRGARAGDRSRDLPRAAGWAADARGSGEGDVLQDRRDRGLSRLPAAGSRQRRRAGGGAIAAVASSVLTGGTDTHLSSSTCARRSGRARPPRIVSTRSDHRQPEHGAVRRAAADRRIGYSRRGRRRRRCAGSTKRTSREVARIICGSLADGRRRRRARSPVERALRRAAAYAGLTGFATYARGAARERPASPRSSIRSSRTSSACFAT